MREIDKVTHPYHLHEVSLSYFETWDNFLEASNLSKLWFGVQ